jgi:putative ABC transport system substrate-binding protein
MRTYPGYNSAPHRCYRPLHFRDFITEILREDIAQTAKEAGIAVVSEHWKFAKSGALLSYGASIPDLFRRTAGYVAQILNGANPAELPIQLPAKYELAGFCHEMPGFCR